MGYTTDFSGQLEFDTPLTKEQSSYINLFSGTRRMKRDVEVLKEMYNGENGLSGIYGIEGAYFAKDDGNCGQNEDGSVIDHNMPPIGVPGLWCQWEITNDGKTLEWDGGEKFYSYVEWLQYLIDNFFNKWGVKLNGEIDWFGEERDDMGAIIVEDSKITTKQGKITYE